MFSLAAVISKILEGLSKLAAPLFFYLKGRKDKEMSIAAEDAKVLKKQRDNNVYTPADADKLWVKLRKDK